MNHVQRTLPGILDATENTDSAESSAEWVWIDEPEEETLEAFVHATVMKDEVIAALAPHDGGVYVDATLGGGGHTEAILSAAPGARVFGFDRDRIALDAAAQRLATFGDRFVPVRATFATMRAELDARGIGKVDGVCADLGVSSPQLDDASRGMSFRREGPIDMRMDQENGETALDLIERLDDDELADVIYKYGDERRSRRIARSLHRAFIEGELVTTLDLRRAIVRAVGPVRVGGVDPATRTFQALRIAVNQEMQELEGLLTALPNVVCEDGVAAVISFHSLEDRLVKHAFLVKDTWTPLWKKPISATDDERADNTRARSAKLRAARRNGEPG